MLKLGFLVKPFVRLNLVPCFIKTMSSRRLMRFHEKLSRLQRSREEEQNMRKEIMNELKSKKWQRDQLVDRVRAVKINL